MHSSKDTIRQSATIVRISGSELELEVCRPDACVACKAKSACAEGGSQGRRMTLPNDGQDYTVGEQVMLVMNNKSGLKAVVMAYLMPVVIIVGLLLLFQVMQIDETVAALVTLGALGGYFVAIRLFRDKIGRELIIEIEKG